jgi:hypothetical protein
MDATARELRQVLSSTATPDSTLLLDWMNRISLEILRTSRWHFLYSPPQKFITERGVTDYWLGAVGSSPAGAQDTGLNLSDVRTIKAGTVFDRTNFVPLGKTEEPPLTAKVAYPDDTSRMGRPAVWRQATDTPQVLNIYPAPDNQSLYQPQPETPICSTYAGGSFGNRTYFVTCTFVDSVDNESTSPFPAEIFVPAGFLLKVKSPVEPYPKSATGIQYNRYHVYAAQAANNMSALASGSLFKQTDGNPVNTGTDFSEGSGLVTNTSAPPTTNGVEPIDGYIIEFRYAKQRIQLTDPTQILQIPDDYKDVVMAGVTAKAFHYLFRPTEAGQWFGLYKDGTSQIIRDLNLTRSQEFIRPDASAIGGRLPAVESIDLSVLQN